MTPWIQVYSNLGRHPKVYRLAERLEIRCRAVHSTVVVVGMLVSLWTWCSQCSEDGDLSRCSPEALADICRWRGDPEELWNALREAGWLDEDGHLHDWSQHEGMLMDAQEQAREKNRERQRRFRERRRGEAQEGQAPRNAARNAAVTPTKVSVTPNNAPTRPDHTPPNQTKPSPNTETTPKPEPLPMGAPQLPGNGEVVAVEAVEREFLTRVNPNASRTCLRELRGFAGELGAELCHKAIETAIDNQKCTWPYLRGILRRMKSEGIGSLEAWEAARARHDSALLRCVSVSPPLSQEDRTLEERRTLEEVARNRRILERMKAEKAAG